MSYDRYAIVMRRKERILVLLPTARVSIIFEECPSEFVSDHCRVTITAELQKAAIMVDYAWNDMEERDPDSDSVP
jgi:hypothetical protein